MVPFQIASCLSVYGLNGLSVEAQPAPVYLITSMISSDSEAKYGCRKVTPW